MYPNNRIIRKHQQRASESRYLNHSTQCASVSRIRLQKGRRSAQPIAEHTHRPKMNFPIWGIALDQLSPQKFSPSGQAQSQTLDQRKIPPLPAPNSNLDRHTETYTQHRSRASRISSGRRGFSPYLGGSRGAAAGPALGGTGRWAPWRRRRRRDRDRGRWEIWGFRVSVASTEQAWVGLFSHLLLGACG